MFLQKDEDTMDKIYEKLRENGNKMPLRIKIRRRQLKFLLRKLDIHEEERGNALLS